jgi:hypothetical protein
LSTLASSVVGSEGRGRCLDRNAIAESAPRSGHRYSNGRCGLSRSCTSKSDLSSCSMKPQGSERKKSMSLSGRLPAKPMNLNAMGWQACFLPGNKAGKEQPQKHFHQRSASSLWTCMLNYRRCPGEKSPRFATFVTEEDQTIRVSNTLPPLVLRHLCQPDATSPGT